MQRGGKGIKVIVSGRLGGAEIARSYSDKDGKIPLHTLRADIDYGIAEARTQYGNIGVKVWIYRGEILPGTAPLPPQRERPALPAARPAAGGAPADAPAKKGWKRVARTEAAPADARADAPADEAVAAAPLTDTVGETPVVETPAVPAADSATEGPETSA